MKIQNGKTRQQRGTTGRQDPRRDTDSHSNLLIPDKFTVTLSAGRMINDCDSRSFWYGGRIECSLTKTYHSLSPPTAMFLLPSLLQTPAAALWATTQQRQGHREW